MGPLRSFSFEHQDKGVSAGQTYLTFRVLICQKFEQNCETTGRTAMNTMITETSPSTFNHVLHPIVVLVFFLFFLFFFFFFSSSSSSSFFFFFFFLVVMVAQSISQGPHSTEVYGEDGSPRHVAFPPPVNTLYDFSKAATTLFFLIADFKQ